MTLNLYDTESREIKPVAVRAGKDSLGIYCCGPTVYGPAHIGNFRTFLLQDVLRRVLEITLGSTAVTHVRNITDVDDKTIRQSRSEGVPLDVFTQRWTKRFHADCVALHLLPPHHEPTATGHIDEQIEMIRQLVDKGNAYVAHDGSVYFRVASFEDYGRLSHLDKSSLRTQEQNSAGERNDADEYERESIADFALWKAHKEEDGDVSWDSPWGPGRPGWHIECSAMASHYLGNTLDIHCGGVDLCFPHHENEIAQSECTHGCRFVQHWFHTAHLMVDGGKMSKSLGNLYTLEDLVAKGYSPQEVRYALIAGHYRQQLNFTLKSLEDARSALQRAGRFTRETLAKAEMTAEDFSRAISDAPGQTTRGDSEAWQAICDDLNTPSALGKLFILLRTGCATREEARLKAFALARIYFALGITPELTDPVNEVVAPDDVLQLAQQRWQAKQDKDWARADSLRDAIQAKGWIVKDSKDSYSLIPE